MASLLSRINAKHLLNLSLFLMFFHEINYGNFKVTLPSHLLFTSSLLVSFAVFGKLDKRLLVGFLFFSIICSFYVFKSYLFFSHLKYLIFLSPALIIPFLVSMQEFENTFLRLIIIITSFSLILFLLGIGVDNGYGHPRMQGVISEPSAFSLPLAILLINSLQKPIKQKIIFLVIGCIATYLTKSPTVYIVIILSFILFLISFQRFLIQILFISSSVFLIYFSLDILIWTNSILENNILTRVIDGFTGIATLGTSGYNPRVIGILQFYQDVTSNESVFWFGRGLDAATSFYQEKGTLRYTYNLPSEVMFSVGFIGLVFYLSLVLLCLKISIKTKQSKSIFLPILTYTTLNSAMGLSFQILIGIYLMFTIKSIFNEIDNRKYKPQINEKDSNEKRDF